jgi:hypothetical protein
MAMTNSVKARLSRAFLLYGRNSADMPLHHHFPRSIVAGNLDSGAFSRKAGFVSAARAASWLVRLNPRKSESPEV